MTHDRSLPRALSAAGWLPAIACCLALALYASTTAPGLTWAHHGADGGDLIAATMTGGVPHPSGYPTYCLLARLFAYLPLGNIAHRFNLFSSVVGALAVGLAADVALRILRLIGATHPVRQRASVIGTALTLTVSPLLWSQAVITEVYALNLALVFLSVDLGLAIDDGSAAWRWGLLGLSLGAGLGNHLTLLALAPSLAIWLWPWRSRCRSAFAALGLLLGLTVYARTLVAARGASPVNWGDAHSLHGLLWLMSGRLYRPYLGDLSAGTLLSRLGSSLSRWLQQFTPVGAGLAVVGFAALARRPGPSRRLACALALAATLWWLYALVYGTPDSFLYILPVYGLTAVCLGCGAWVLAADSKPHAPLRWLVRALPLMLAIFGALRHGAALNLRADTEAATWVKRTLDALPADSVVITAEDRHTFALAYAVYVERRRDDVILIDGELWAQEWYATPLRKRHEPLREAPAALERAVDVLTQTTTVCLTTDRQALTAARRYMPVGPLLCLAPEAAR